MTIHSDITDIDLIQWNELVKKSPTSSFFQTPECYDFYASLSFMKPFVFAVSEDNKLVGLICGYIIADGNIFKQFFSRRAIVPGGALLDETITTSALANLLSFVAKDLKHKAIYVEIRNYNNYSFCISAFESIGFSYQQHLNFHVSTQNVDAVFKQLSSSKRRQIKQTLNAGVKIKVAESSDEINQLYKLLNDLYRNKVKLPLFPITFFENLRTLENGKIIVLIYGEKVIGGIACVMLNKSVVYEWFVCGDDKIQKNLYPSVLATWGGIEYAANNGYERFDFMGAGKPDEGYGVREFKSKFGGELVEHGRFLYICKPRMYSLGKYAIKKLKSFK